MNAKITEVEIIPNICVIFTPKGTIFIHKNTQKNKDYETTSIQLCAPAACRPQCPTPLKYVNFKPATDAD